MKPNKNNLFKETFEIEGIKIDVNYQTISPEKINQNPNKLIIVLPGWSLNANSKSVKIIQQAFADIGNCKVLAIDTKPNDLAFDTLYKEAQAINNLLIKRKERDIIVAGYSEGGIKAINLTTILQKNKKFNVEGIILMESMGLYTQESVQKMVGSFIKDTLIDTPISIGKNVIVKRDLRSIKTGLQTGTDIIFGILKEIKRSHIKYPKRMMLQINEMISKSNRLIEIKVPVILIQGINDPVSNPKKVIPLSKMLQGGPHNPEREKFLRENVFPNSPYIKLLVGKKAVPHHAMPFEDADRIAKASLYLIGKSKEKTKQNIFTKIKLFLFKRD